MGGHQMLACSSGSSRKHLWKQRWLLCSATLPKCCQPLEAEMATLWCNSADVLPTFGSRDGYSVVQLCQCAANLWKQRLPLCSATRPMCCQPLEAEMATLQCNSADVLPTFGSRDGYSVVQLGRCAASLWKQRWLPCSATRPMCCQPLEAEMATL